MSISTPQAMAEYVISNGTQWDARRAGLWLKHGQTAALRSLFIRLYHTDTARSGSMSIHTAVASTLQEITATLSLAAEMEGEYLALTDADPTDTAAASTLAYVQRVLADNSTSALICLQLLDLNTSRQPIESCPAPALTRANLAHLITAIR